MLSNRIDPKDKCLLLSGEDFLGNTDQGGTLRDTGCEVSRSAPTFLFLAVELADEFNLAVVGFARGERLTVYSHPERVSM